VESISKRKNTVYNARKRQIKSSNTIQADWKTGFADRTSGDFIVIILALRDLGSCVWVL
jgi:hypothetical protein